MDPQAIDLSSLGAIKAAPAPAAPPAAPASPAGAIDLSSLGGIPHNQAQAVAHPSAQLADNPNNEGVYQMQGPHGAVGVPYSKVDTARQQGYKFQDGMSLFGTPQGENARFLKDQAADPNYIHHTAEFQKQGEQGIGSGFAKQGQATVAGVLHILAAGNHRLRAAAGMTQGDAIEQHMRDAADWLNKGNDLDGFWEGLGGFSENIAELLTPEALGTLAKGAEAVKAGEVAGAAEKYANAGKVAAVLKKYPVIAKLAGLGMAAARAGAEAGGQTFVKTGGDVDQAEEAAAAGAGGGAALHGAGDLMAGLVRSMARPAVTREAVGDAAKAALEERIGATNATRGAVPATENAGEFQFNIGGTPTRDTTEGSIAQQPRKQQMGTRVISGKGPSERQIYIDPATNVPKVVDIHAGDTEAPGSHRAPSYRLSEESKPGTKTRADSAGGGGTLVTKDVKTASSHLANLQNVMASGDFAELSPAEQSTIRAQRDDIKQQISDYYRHQKAIQGSAPAIGPPTQVQKAFKPISPTEAIQQTGNFADAAEHLQQAGAEVYDHANNVTGGQWQALDGHIEKLYDQLGKEPYEPGRREIRSQIAQAKNEMSRILDEPTNGFDAEDITQAKRNFRAKYVLQDAHASIKPLYGLEEQTGRTTGQYRGFNGNMLGARFKEFLAANPDARSIIGPDRVDTLQQLFHANDTLAARKRFANAVLAVASAAGGYTYHGLGMGGAVGAEVGYQSIRHVLDSMVANPNVAKNLLFAIDSGARPENYSKLIAGMIDAVKTTTRAAVPAAAGAATREVNGGN